MKTVKYITLCVTLVAVVSFYSCADLTPPYGGWLWVVTNEEGYGDRGSIMRLEPSTGEMINWYRAPAPWYSNNFGLAYGNGLVWVGWEEKDPYSGEHTGYFIRWLDPSTGDDGEPVEIEIPPLGLAWVNDELWAAKGDDFYRINPNTGVIEETFTTTTYVYSRGLAWDDSYLWVPDNYNERIYKIDRKSGDVLRGIKAPCDHMAGLAWDGAALWVNDEDNRYAYRVSPDDGDVLGSYYYPFDSGQFPYGLAFEFPDGTGN
ncbi:MAG: hypothetical protein JSW52_08945 [Candidatus Coatesbacteria bacterium]|nr:MAG: hypothetical protein JSW52_08945 [Candidatus Coatesbacteria bacterium]